MRTTPTPSRPILALILAAAAALTPVGARAADAAHTPDAAAGEGLSVSWSAFGTVGVAQTDQPWRYQRFLRDEVSAERDTLFGAQADVQFTPQWSATLQAKLAPAANHDARWDLSAAWAFVAWRPSNDWLVRAGKLRVPFLLRSEQLDVGQTYDEARLPGETYTLAPTNDFEGAHVSHSWQHADGDLSLEGYVGATALYKRFWVRDEIPAPAPGMDPLLPAGALFKSVNVSVRGLVLTWRAPDLVARFGVHHARTHRPDGSGFAVRPSWAPLGPGIGYWQTDNALPGPGVLEVPRIRNVLITAGAEAQLGGGWRVAGELLHLEQQDSETGVDGWAGYATLYRSLGAFTPYVTLAASRTGERSAYWRRQLDTTSVPALVPGAGLLNASMRAQADTTPVYRQASLALGSSYALTPTSKLKVEWLHTRATDSQLIDVPSGEPLQQRRSVNVLSASYNFVF